MNHFENKIFVFSVLMDTAPKTLWLTLITKTRGEKKKQTQKTVLSAVSTVVLSLCSGAVIFAEKTVLQVFVY